jgi:hypothetical protein
MPVAFYSAANAVAYVLPYTWTTSTWGLLGQLNTASIFHISLGHIHWIIARFWYWGQGSWVVTASLNWQIWLWQCPTDKSGCDSVLLTNLVVTVSLYWQIWMWNYPWTDKSGCNSVLDKSVSDCHWTGKFGCESIRELANLLVTVSLCWQIWL